MNDDYRIDSCLNQLGFEEDVHPAVKGARRKIFKKQWEKLLAPLCVPPPPARGGVPVDEQGDPPAGENLLLYRHQAISTASAVQELACLCRSQSVMSWMPVYACRS